MKIAIDARPTQGSFTGDATYWRGLIGGLTQLEDNDEYLLYYYSKLSKPESLAIPNFHSRVISSFNWRTWSAFSFPLSVNAEKADIVHVQYSVPPFISCDIITSVHDVSFKRHPEYFHFKDRYLLDLGMKQACKRAYKILAISEYTKSEICDLYPIKEDRVEVVYPGVEPIFYPRDKNDSLMHIKNKFHINNSYILTLGVIQPRKNLPRLIEGFAIWKKQTDFIHKLVITGKYGWMAEDIEKKISEFNISEDVIFTGYADYDDLPYLYSAADLFVYPSVYEGFGLPPAEAMACGTPVVTGNKTSLPEVVGNAGIMVDPYNAEEFAKAIDDVLKDSSLRLKMSQNGINQSKLFNWVNTAKIVNNIYHKNI